MTIVDWALEHWWVFFRLAAFGVFEAVRDFFAGLAGSVSNAPAVRHERKLELAQASTTERAPVEPQRPLPGQCVHRRITQVRDRNDELVGWLCKGCDKQLPADWAVAAEDLP